MTSRAACCRLLVATALLGAGTSGWGHQLAGIKADEVIPRAKKQFKLMRSDIDEKYPQQPELKVYVDVTEQQFILGAKEKLTAEEYNPREVWLLGRVVRDVLTPVVAGLAEMASQERSEEEVSRIRADIARAAQANTVKMFAAMPAQLADLKEQDPQLAKLGVIDPAGGGVLLDPPGTVGGKTGALLGTEGHAAGPAHGDEDKPKDGHSEPGRYGSTHGGGHMTQAEKEQFIKDSVVIQLGMTAATYAVEHRPGSTDPSNPPKPPTPGVPTGPGTGGGSGAAPPSPAPAPGGGGVLLPSDAFGAIIRTGGSQQMADRGAEMLKMGDYNGAASSARRALAINPRNQSAMAVLYSAQGRIAGADAGAAGSRASNAQAQALGEGRGDAGLIGAGSAAGARPEIAAAALSGAARAASDQARAGAMSALKLGDPKSAIEILSKALAENPANPALLNLRAQTYGRLGRWEEALKDAVAGLALAPGNMVLLNTKALSENRTRRWRDAIATADMMIAADPKNAWAFANRAHAWGGLGDREAMLADINRAAALDPRFRKAADDAALVQLPSDSDVVFLFPGESPKPASKAPAPAPGRGRSFRVVVGAGIAGGLLLALGLLSTVMGPLKDTVVSVFTRVDRKEPAAGAVATAQPASVAGEVGGLIRGQYEISRQIGAGGMGMVYEGTDRSLGRRVAIKKMREELRVNARERDRFIIEAKTVASLHHPNIVDIYAIAEEGDDVYLVFEFVDGRTVHDLVQSKGRLEPADAVRAARAMGEALAYAHAHGVIHRDMKPSNVMVTGDGRIKVMDFGIARMAKDALTRYSMTNTVVGTPPYMAPEQEQGVVRKESDVYSLGICAYEMLTGKLPFIGIGAGMLMNKINMSYVPPSRAIAGLPEALDEVFSKAFQADPDRRYRTPQDFVAAFEAAAGGARSGTGTA